MRQDNYGWLHKRELLADLGYGAVRSPTPSRLEVEERTQRSHRPAIPPSQNGSTRARRSMSCMQLELAYLMEHTIPTAVQSATRRARPFAWCCVTCYLEQSEGASISKWTPWAATPWQRWTPGIYTLLSGPHAPQRRE